MIDVEKMVCHNEDTSILYHHGASRISKKAFQQAKTIITDNPNAALVVYTGAERRSEESTCCRSSESNDSYLLLSGGYCGEDEFISEEALNDIA